MVAPSSHEPPRPPLVRPRLLEGLDPSVAHRLLAEGVASLSDLGIYLPAIMLTTVLTNVA